CGSFLGLASWSSNMAGCGVGRVAVTVSGAEVWALPGLQALLLRPILLGEPVGDLLGLDLALEYAVLVSVRRGDAWVVQWVPMVSHRCLLPVRESWGRAWPGRKHHRQVHQRRPASRCRCAAPAQP